MIAPPGAVVTAYDPAVQKALAGPGLRRCRASSGELELNSTLLPSPKVSSHGSMFFALLGTLRVTLLHGTTVRIGTYLLRLKSCVHDGRRR